MYNTHAGRRFDEKGYVYAQRSLVQRVRAKIVGRGAIRSYANNLDSWEDAPVLLAPGTLLDGGAKEGFIGTGNGSCGFAGAWHNWSEPKWTSIMDGLLNVYRGGLPVMPMVASAGCESPQLVSQPRAVRDAVEGFAYASFLLVARTREQLLGVVPYRFRDEARGAAGGMEMWLHRRYYWPIGQPVQKSRTHRRLGRLASRRVRTHGGSRARLFS